MPKTRNFKHIVKQAFLSEIEKMVADYVEENYDRLELESKSQRIKRVDEAFVQNQRLHRIIPYDSLRDTFSFDAVIEANIAIFQTAHSQAVEDDVSRWFRISCEATAKNGFENFTINGIDEYDHKENNPRKMLKDNLVPIIYAVDLDKHATDIVKLVYPEALTEPTRIDVRLFAQRLDLKIEERRLSRSGTIFGQMIFHTTEVEYFDLDAKRFRVLEADGGTVFVDPEIYFLRTLGSWNNTVIHECVHWLKHRKYFELERAYSGNISRISCQVSDVPNEENTRSETEWMEWHANALAPRILMPYTTFKQKAEELIAWHKGERQTIKTSDIIATVIYELADFFEVSALSTKIRMIDIGYTEAVGVLEYVDDKYITSHAFKDGALGKNQTYTIPMKDGLYQYAVNTDFRKLIDTGSFVYVDGHYCLNDPKYVEHDGFDTIEMTTYALEHMDECCIVFNKTPIPNPNYGEKRYKECVLFQSAVAKTITDYKFNPADQNNAVHGLLAEISEAKEAAQILSTLPRNFGEAVKSLMKRRNLANEELAEKSQLAAKTIQRLRNSSDDSDHKKETVIAVCIGLQLFPTVSTELLTLAGVTLKHTEQDILYRHILNTRYKSSIHDCNELLVVADFPRLTGAE